MDEEIADLVFGGDLGAEVLGKEPDWVGPFRKFAIVLGIAIVGTFFGSVFLEEYRLQALMQEVRSMSLNGIQCAVEEMQNIGEDDMEYLFDESGNPTVEYEKYLDALDSVEDDYELKNVVNILRNGDSNGESYTPLSFNLTFLDVNKLRNLVNSNLSDIFNVTNSGMYDSSVEITNDMNNGSIMEELIFGVDRTEYTGCDIEIERIKVIDITDVNKCNEEEKAMYRAVYGTEAQSASQLDGLGLTDRHYLIVYQVKYIVSWIPYTHSIFFHRAQSSSAENSGGFVALPEMTDEYTELYYITN